MRSTSRWGSRPQTTTTSLRAGAYSRDKRNGGIIFSADDLAAAVGGRVEKRAQAGAVATDSRKVEEGEWFLALRGERYDGREFVSDAIRRGAKGVVIETTSSDEDERFLSTLRDEEGAGLVLARGSSGGIHCLGRLANFVRRQYRGKVVAITGSCGKTSTRAMVGHLVRGLRGADSIHETEGNENNLVGLPQTLLKLPSESSICLLELGMSRPGEIFDLQAICEPDVRVVTNVGLAHLDGCGGTLDGVARAKEELVASARPGDICVLNHDDPKVAKMTVPEGARCVRFGWGKDCEVRILGSEAMGEDRMRTRVTMEVGSIGEVEADLRQPGHHIASMNAAAAVATVLALGLDFDLATLRRGLSTFSSGVQKGRGIVREYYWGIKAIAVIDETYNANPTSMTAALETLKQSGSNGSNKHAVLGDMLELGSAAEGQHLEILRKYLEAEEVQTVALVGAHFEAAAAAAVVCEGGEGRVVVCRDAEEAAMATLERCGDGDVVLVKGSRGVRMERFFQVNGGLIGGV